MSDANKFRWDEQRFNENELFREALNSTKLRDALFTEKFMDGLEKRRDALEGRSQKVLLVQLSMSLLLLLALLVPNISISIFGLSARAGSLREVFLFISASAQMYMMLPAIEQARITDIMLLYVQKHAAGNPAVFRALKLRYGLGISAPAPPDLHHRRLSGWQTLYFVIGGLSMILWLLGMVLLFILIELASVISILLNPTYSFGVSLLLCIYVVAMSATNFGIRAFAGVITNRVQPDGP